MSTKILATIKKCLILETGGVAIKKLVGLKPKMYSFLVDSNSEHKKSKTHE